MTETSLVHALDDHIELRHRGQLLFRYVYRPATNQMESPRPYFHPLRTLAGDTATIFRPYDHLWHHGLSMTTSYLSGENFWGGPTYLRDQGYVQLDNNGSMEHEAWEHVVLDGGLPLLREHLRWRTQGGEDWIEERRRIQVVDIRPEEGWWALGFSFSLRNVSGVTLEFGSPTTQGRPAAGYGGLFWRGPRSFLHGTILAADGLEGPGVMGRRAPWLAYVGSHDGSANTSTIVLCDHPSNPRYPTTWFVRSEPYACASCAFTFEETYRLESGEALDLRYAVALANGRLPRDRIDQLAREVGASA